MKNRIRILLSAVLLVIFMLSMATLAAATEAEPTEPTTAPTTEPTTAPTTEPTTEHTHSWTGSRMDMINHQKTCTICGESRVETHQPNGSGTCSVCGASTCPNWHVFVGNSKRCAVCGYEESPHIWRYGDNYNHTSHSAVCTHCGETRYEAHYIEPNGHCLQCDYHIGLQETEPTETEPTETEPTETEPTETEPTETKPTETEPTETEPAQTQPEATETAADPAETEEPESDSSAGIWLAAALGFAGGLGAAVIGLKLRSNTKPAK